MGEGNLYGAMRRIAEELEKKYSLEEGIEYLQSQRVDIEDFFKVISNDERYPKHFESIVDPNNTKYRLRFEGLQTHRSHISGSCYVCDPEDGKERWIHIHYPPLHLPESSRQSKKGFVEKIINLLSFRRK